MAKKSSQNSPKGAATRRDVAEASGVTPSTVSLVLNNTPGARISEETRERVKAAAKKLGYQPSFIGRALASGETKTIGLALHWGGRPFHSFMTNILDGFWDVCHSEGYRILVQAAQLDAGVAGFFRERFVDGLLTFAMPYDANDEELIAMAEANFPAVSVGSYSKHVKLDYVDVDNEAVGYHATKRLLDLGHTRILHLAGPIDVNSSAVDRYAGYCKAMHEAGITDLDDLVLYGSYSQIVSRTELEKAMKKGLDFTAIFAANHGMAHAARVLLGEKGLSVPEDCSIVAIDKHNPEGVSGVEIARYSQPLYDIGRTAAKQLLERIRGYDGEARNTLLSAEYVAGNSLAGPKSG